MCIMRFSSMISANEIKILFLILLIIQKSHEPYCCIDIRNHPSCKIACQQVSLLSSREEINQKMLNVQTLCPASLSTFWNCMNKTLRAVDKAMGWPGRQCCNLIISPGCLERCAKATSKKQLHESCRQSEEHLFFSCLKRLHEGETCCGNASNKECQNACWRIFRKESSPTQDDKLTIQNKCSPSNKHVLRCIQNFTKTTPAKNPTSNLICCEQSQNKNCKKKCKEILNNVTTEQEIMEQLIENCGPASPQNPLWKCFIRNSEAKNDANRYAKNNKIRNKHGGKPVISRLDLTGLDTVKLQCCSRAFNPTCTDLCIKSYSVGWSNNWNEFTEQCQYNPLETALIACLDEVDHPCTLGCSGLRYCKNFNNRPVSMFRGCNSQSDASARQLMAMWSKTSTISLPVLDIPVKDITQCFPEKWKAIACVLEIKPCHIQTHTSLICKSDCIDILTKCADEGRLLPNQTPKGLCNILSPLDSKQPCISIKDYLDENVSFYKNLSDISYPCKDKKCLTSEVCSVSKTCPATLRSPSSALIPYNTPSCQEYECLPGCVLGEISNFLVSQNTWIHLPINGKNTNCLRVCQCSSDNQITDCVKLPCFGQRHCWIQDTVKKHRSQFYIDCNLCSCFNSAVLCTLRHCPDLYWNSHEREIYTGLPCNCPAHYVPVCGFNGKTYPSACLARCSGISDDLFEYGSCHLEDPCSLSNSCKDGEICVVRQQICLSISAQNINQCKQYACVKPKKICEKSFDGDLFTSECQTDSLDLPLTYNSLKFNACGYNGETYDSSKTSALIDYHETCRGVGLLSLSDATNPRCRGVICEEVVSSFCRGITPPGTCCPICAAEIRVLYSKDIVNLLQENVPIPLVTLQNVTEALKKHLRIPQCSLFGFLSIESDLVFLIKAKEKYPTVIQVEACNREAERLATLLSNSIPTLMVEIPLFILTAASVRVPQVTSASSISFHHFFLTSPVQILSYLIAVKVIKNVLT